MLPGFRRDNAHPAFPDRPLFNDDDDEDVSKRATAKYAVKELRAWGRKNIRLSDDPHMSAKVDWQDLGSQQRLVFRNIRVGDTEVSALLDCEVLRLLPTRFSPLPDALENAIQFRDTGNMGTGVFATQDIRAASVLLVEYPVTVVQNTFALNFGMTRAEVYGELVNRVPENALPALLQLHNAQPSGLYSQEEGLVRSNALGIALPAPCAPVPAAMGHCAVFLKASRINHSCAPNAIARFDTQSFTLVVRALRPITKGEELVLSYIDLDHFVTRAERQTRIRDLCHFDCLCAQCTLPTPTAVAESDARRERIFSTTRAATFVPFTTWHQAPGRSTNQGGLQQVIAFHLAAIGDMTAEGLYGYAYFLHSAALAICFAALEDVIGFRAWMGRAREFALCNVVTESAAEMLKNIVYPDTFMWWGAANRGASGA
ncbi:hypothetical protein FB45DRAFT_187777 [Roridomyces roridus]|uniref:SET domain-containing protein n=1 Tax=Roridomyces roridus TaxID=1738132 RepID=A0AAD7CER7_9AGAR|nr:hypothetical protein FB45DRAFT_187777 [Roridomyces roridus]